MSLGNRRYGQDLHNYRPGCAAVPLMDDNCFNGCTIICSSTPTSCFDIPHSVDSFTFEAYFIFFLLIFWEVILRMRRFSVSVRKLALSKFVFVEVALLVFFTSIIFFFLSCFSQKRFRRFH